MSFHLTDSVKSYISSLYNAIRDRNLYEITSIYDIGFSKITEKYFKVSSWPSFDDISLVVQDDDPIFLLLYKELYYRHIYSKLRPTVSDRCDSFANYCSIFDILLDPSRTKLEFDILFLPSPWLYDMIAEFIFQFQEFCQWRAVLDDKETMSLLLSRENVWNSTTVLEYLKNISSFCINIEENENNTKKQFGFFALSGLLTVYCILGDYSNALSSFNIDLRKRHLLQRFPACHISTYYYLGFSYLMLHRYIDAIKTFSSVLHFVNKTKNLALRCYQLEPSLLLIDRMYHLFGIAYSIFPQRIDENLLKLIIEKCGNDWNSYLKFDIPVIESAFLTNCPGFINPSSNDEDSPDQPLKQQSQIFIKEVEQRKVLSNLLSWIKLYSSIPIKVLAEKMEISINELHTLLLNIKHKYRSLRWHEGVPFSGIMESNNSDITFYIEDEVLYSHIPPITRRYGDIFIRSISRWEESIKEVSRLE